jgi:prepilin-type N-terminal cleavage/methylation domain-containing protein
MKLHWRAQRLAAADGFTLIEMLVSLAAGVILMFATLGAFDVSARQSAAAGDRVEATQNGRTTMERLLQELNSSCVWSTAAPVQAGSDGSHIWFLTAYSSTPLPNPVLHQVWLAPGGVLDDASYTLVNPSTPPGNWTSSAFNGTPTSSRLLAKGISYISGTGAMFQYYQYLNGQLALDSAHRLSTPLDTTSAPLVGAVTISYAAAPSSNSSQADRSINLNDTAAIAPPPGPGGGCQ